MKDNHSLFEAARAVIPGGVNSPVRAFKSVGGDPIFFAKAKGPFVYSAEGKEYIDYIGSWGPMILGHAHPDVINAVCETARHGLSFGAPCEGETALAEKVCARFSSIEQVRFVNSGTEAAMSALRLARGYTGREMVVKFAGCYHGHTDSLLVKAGSGAITLGVPTSPGVTAGTTAQTITLPYNDVEALETLFASRGAEIACVMVEPIAGNMNCVIPSQAFHDTLRRLTQAHGALLIFDEVMTGFRVNYSGAQALFNIEPDMTALGKIIGGGMPVGAFGGKAEVMAHLAPDGPVYQAGTLSGNPVAMASGFATLTATERPGFYEELEQKTRYLVDGLRAAASATNTNMQFTQTTGMFGFFFTDGDRINGLADVERCDVERFKAFFHAMLRRGIYLAPSMYEAGFVSITHTTDVLDRTIDAAEEALRETA